MLVSAQFNEFRPAVSMSSQYNDVSSKFKRGNNKLDRLRLLMRSQKSGDFRRHSVNQSQDNQYRIPIIQLNNVQLPVDSVPLNIFESRYRLMFKLLKDTVDRQFGVVWGNGEKDLQKRVGVLCELTHFLAMPQKGCVFVNGIGVGRFQVKEVVENEPYVVANVQNVVDTNIIQKNMGNANQIGNTEVKQMEMEAWKRLQQIRITANKLYPQQLPGDAILTQETIRWSPDRHNVDSLPLLPSEIICKIDSLKLQQNATEMQEYFSRYCIRDLSEDERMQNFSFVALKGITQNMNQLQAALNTRDTLSRFQMVEEGLIGCQNRLSLLQEESMD